MCHACLSVDHVLLVFMKLRLGLLQEDLAHRFGLELTIVSNVYRLWLPVLSKYVRALIGWPDRNSIIRHMPVCFRRKYRVCICIIDCIEIFIERPSKLTAVEIANRHKFSWCSDSSLWRLGWSSIR